MKKLEENAAVDQPAFLNAYFVDAMFFIHTIPNVPAMYGGSFTSNPSTCNALLQPKCTLFVTYVEGPSIEAHEQSARGDIHAKYTITGPSQQCPSDFNGALLLSHFKPELINFLVDEWASGKYFTVLKDHVLYFATAESCHKYCAANGLVTEDGDSGIGS